MADKEEQPIRWAFVGGCGHAAAEERWGTDQFQKWTVGADGRDCEGRTGPGGRGKKASSKEASSFLNTRDNSLAILLCSEAALKAVQCNAQEQ